MPTTYYPFPETDTQWVIDGTPGSPPDVQIQIPVPFQGSVKRAARFIINSDDPPALSDPQNTTSELWLTVNGRAGIGFDFPGDYDKEAPELNVVGRVRIGSTVGVDNISSGASSTYPSNAPQLTVEGKASIGPAVKAGTTFAAKAPQLSVAGTVGIGYDFTAGAELSDTPPALGVSGKVAIGESADYDAGAAPHLRVRGDARIAQRDDDPPTGGNLAVDRSATFQEDLFVGRHSKLNGRVYFMNTNVGSGESEAPERDVTYIKNELAALAAKVSIVSGKVEVLEGKVDVLEGKVEVLEGDVETLKGNVEAVAGKVLVVEGKVQVIDAKLDVLGGKVVLLEGKVQLTDGTTAFIGTALKLVGARVDALEARLAKLETGRQWSGVFVDTSSPQELWDSTIVRKTIQHPVFAVVNGLTGQVQIQKKLSQANEDLETEIADAIDAKTNQPESEYVLMGDLRGLLRKTPPFMDIPHSKAYGIRANWDSHFAMFNIVDVTPYGKFDPGKEYKRAELKDAILAWGSSDKKQGTLKNGRPKPRTRFRLRYIGHEESSKAKAAAELKYVTPGTALPKDTRLGEVAVVSKTSRTEVATRPESRGKKGRRRRAPEIDIDESGARPAGKGGLIFRDIVIVDPRGSVQVNGTLFVARSCKRSDATLKEAVQPIQGALEKVMAMRGVTFTWKDAPDRPLAGKKEYGMIAQEVKALCPEAVSRDDEKLLAIDYDQITPVLLEALKEQQQTIDSQRERLDKLEAALRKLAKKPPSKTSPKKKATGARTK